MGKQDLAQVAKIMDRFVETQEDMDVQANYVESTMNSASSTLTPVDEVNSLINMVADENMLDIKALMPEFVSENPVAEASSNNAVKEPQKAEALAL